MISFYKLNILGAILLLPLLFSSCAKNEKPYTELESKGKASYMSNCTACHHIDPNLIGATAPEIAGSSLELLTARIMTKSYPPGHKPKRSSQQMPSMKYLKDDIEALHAYLKRVKKN